MSKCVLVMDMPSSCEECILRNEGACFPVSRESSLCGVYYTMKEGRRADFCPLRELPEKQKHSCIDNEFQRGAKTGYNACIDELLKGEEG